MGDNSLSYFCVNKYASSELIVHLPLKRISSFDINEKFLNSAVKSFVDLYHKTDVKYKIYTQNDLSQIKFY
jgi:hypothetical protein